MDQLKTIFQILVNRTELGFVRYLYRDINWNNRLIAIVGSRGVGKTTMILQHIKQNYDIHSDEVLYASLDNLYFSTHTIIDLADTFRKHGGKVLYLDEVHKYNGWSREIKNIYDSYPDLKVVITGSSMLNIFNSGHDLSRRAIKYTLAGMSFREFVEYEYGVKLEPLSLESILERHVDIASEINLKLKPVAAFKEYLKYGYFPYYKEDKEGYYQRVAETVNTIIDVDLPANIEIEFPTIAKIRKLFSIIADSVPFTPNVSQLAVQVGTTRQSLLNYLNALEKAHALLLLDKEAKGLKRLVKPEKIYLGNTNYAYAFSDKSVEQGNLRETFFYSQLSVSHKITYSDKTDFLVDGKYSFEVGGQGKGGKQIEGLDNAFIAADNIEYGAYNKIPLWLFGLLY
ncbi:MAG: AAA family ATPase [Culturomica sp.]|jgi:predicted AAA+ superfamily ATPase|nr:AAA family ATPase [Culturomica sp.]